MINLFCDKNSITVYNTNGKYEKEWEVVYDLSSFIKIFINETMTAGANLDGDQTIINTAYAKPWIKDLVCSMLMTSLWHKLSAELNNGKIMPIPADRALTIFEQYCNNFAPSFSMGPSFNFQKRVVVTYSCLGIEIREFSGQHQSKWSIRKDFEIFIELFIQALVGIKSNSKLFIDVENASTWVKDTVCAILEKAIMRGGANNPDSLYEVCSNQHDQLALIFTKKCNEIIETMAPLSVPSYREYYYSQTTR